MIHWLIYGSRHAMTTRWHRVKCKVRFTWHMVIKGRIKDWWNNERYVPLRCMTRNEIRSWRVSGLCRHPDGRVHAHHWDGMRLCAALPPGVERFEDLPTFKTSDACFDYARDAWPTLQA